MPLGSPAPTTTSRSGAFGILTSAGSGLDEYISTEFSASSPVFTDGIWACIETAPIGGRRIRSWLAGTVPVVELYLRPDSKLDLRILDVNVITSEETIATCPSFTHIEFEYLAIGSGGSFALSAARALKEHSDLDAAGVVRRALEIAGEICIYTNQDIVVLELPGGEEVA